jgi:oxygen-dependent protoporphyrinogen oxidase
MTHVTIIGGGIAGLATAFYLQRKSGRPISYTLLEESGRLGGKIVTNTVDDFIIEGGPDSFLTQKPWGLQLCRDLGLSDRLLPTNDRQRNVFVLRNGQLIPFPAGYRLAIPTQFLPFAISPLISPLGKLRMGLDLFIPPRRETSDESLADFIRRRLGEEALDMIAEPLMAGIYMADPERLSIQSTFPMFVGLERKHGSLIKAMQVAKWKGYRQKFASLNLFRQECQNSIWTGENKISALLTQKCKKPVDKKPTIFTSLRGGMSELVTTLEAQLTGEVRLNSRVAEIRPATGSGFEVIFADAGTQPLQTDLVVLATPAKITAPMLKSTLPALSTELEKVRYTSTATISLGYRRAEIMSQHDLNGFGFVIPKREERQIMACTWSSTKFSNRVNDDHVLIRVFVGGSGHEALVDLSDEALVTLARMELLVTMGITAKPVMTRIFRWFDGTPQYDVGHLDRVATMEAMTEDLTGLYLTGSSFRGIGIPDCVKSALETVKQIEKNLIDIA